MMLQSITKNTNQHKFIDMRLLMKMENVQQQQQDDSSPRPKRSLAAVDGNEEEKNTPSTPTVESSAKQYMLRYFDDSGSASTDSETLSDGTTDEDDDDDDIDDEAETAVAKALVQAAMRRTLSVPSLMKLIGSTSQRQQEGPALKKARLIQSVQIVGAKNKPPSKPKSNLCREKSASVPTLLKLSPQTRPSTNRNSSNAHFDMKPEDFLKSLLLYHGAEFKTFAALELGDSFFVPVTPEAVAAYDMDVVQDIRNGDVLALRAKKDAGRLLQVCNKFGESVVHTVARRGTSESLLVLKFLLEEAHVSCQVCCDSGRTPLADACWTSSPNFELIGYFLDHCPDLLYITDSRGFTPLAYASREHYGAWCTFLKERSLDGLLPRQLK